MIRPWELSESGSLSEMLSSFFWTSLAHSHVLHFLLPPGRSGASIYLIVLWLNLLTKPLILLGSGTQEKDEKEMLSFINYSQKCFPHTGEEFEA